VVSYSEKHNQANGEHNADGHSENFSDNLGVEGPTDDSRINALRARRRRNLMATLLLSQGTPMILAGDEFGNSQNGNNNAYCQDNEIGWLDWSTADRNFLEFARNLIAFRKAHPILRQKLFLHSRERIVDGIEDLFWWRTDGRPMEAGDWQAPELSVLCAEMRTVSGTPAYAALEYAIFMVFNAGEAQTVTLPATPKGKYWESHIDTSEDHGVKVATPGSSVECPANSVLVMTLETAL
jgi:glycogen operon protein